MKAAGQRPSLGVQNSRSEDRKFNLILGLFFGIICQSAVFHVGFWFEAVSHLDAWMRSGGCFARRWQLPEFPKSQRFMENSSLQALFI
ncbi:hypothetical protein KOR42_08530 [Thalassoglobus neptunius]|uniref:Uncharacterized protein n=1 Tax=Thalassoglobus neptunius TaxID=1938619 RepID=A0A5C5X661_9PLAN|nr:hypothetical protein KOR42_08530 [Thalassoglobus neptunius]